MAQNDFLIGNVLEILDDETFEMEVMRVGRKNRRAYGYEEKIHIHRLKQSEITTLIGPHPKPFLERMLKGKEVMCLVHSREPGGQIEADVFII